MKTFAFIAFAGTFCILGLLLLQYFKDVSVEVISCEIQNGEAIVGVRYKSRVHGHVTFGYNLLIYQNKAASRIGSGIGVVAVKHLASVALSANEVREEVVRVAVPARMIIANATVSNPVLEHVQDAPEEHSQSPEPAQSAVH